MLADQAAGIPMAGFPSAQQSHSFHGQWVLRIEQLMLLGPEDDSTQGMVPVTAHWKDSAELQKAMVGQ